jgi:YVTN family beta-propeller protein
VPRLPGLGAFALVLTLAVVAASCGPAPPNQTSGLPGYRIARDLILPGDTSRWDYMALDSTRGQLFLAHVGAGEVVVVDTGRQRAVATVPGVADVHGLALAPALGRLFASSTARDQVAVIDVASLRVVARVTAGGSPDALAFAPSAGRLFVSQDTGPGADVINMGASPTSSSLSLGAGIGGSQFDPFSGLILVAVGTPAQLVAIDPASLKVVARYALPDCAGPDDVRADVSGSDRAFVDCQDSARLEVVDLAQGRVTASLAVGSQPDILSLDPGTHRLYVAAESGILTVVDTAATPPRVIAQGSAGPGAHAVLVDPSTHLVYLPLPNQGGHPVLRELTCQ